MNRHILISAAALFCASASLGADSPQPAPAIPADAEKALQVLKDSPRHGEWADIALSAADPAAAKIHTWVVYPERKEKAPVVIVIHEIFGLTDWVRAVADQLAAEGFIVLAPDLLSGQGPGGGNSDSFKGDDVRNAIRKLSNDEVVQRLNAVRSYGLALPAATTRCATIGFCWGGSASFMYATRQPALNAAVIYYGTGPMKENTPDRDALGRIACPVLGLYGGDDARVTSTVADTAKALDELKKPFVHHTYEGAGHGFLRQQSGKDGANLKAARESWAATVVFLRDRLK